MEDLTDLTKNIPRWVSDVLKKVLKINSFNEFSFFFFYKKKIINKIKLVKLQNEKVPRVFVMIPDQKIGKNQCKQYICSFKF